MSLPSRPSFFGLRDPATRARILKEMETPSKAWQNEWDEISVPQGVTISVVQNR